MTYNQIHAQRLAIPERLLTEVVRICNFSDPKDIEIVEIVDYHLALPIYSVIPTHMLVWRNPFGEYTIAPTSEELIMMKFDNPNFHYNLRKTI